MRKEDVDDRRTCSEIYSMRFRTYAEHTEKVLGTFPANPKPEVLLSRAIKYNGNEAYHLWVKGHIG